MSQTVDAIVDNAIAIAQAARRPRELQAAVASLQHACEAARSAWRQASTDLSSTVAGLANRLETDTAIARQRDELRDRVADMQLAIDLLHAEMRAERTRADELARAVTTDQQWKQLAMALCKAAVAWQENPLGDRQRTTLLDAVAAYQGV